MEDRVKEAYESRQVVTASILGKGFDEEDSVWNSIHDVETFWEFADTHLAPILVKERYDVMQSMFKCSQ